MINRSFLIVPFVLVVCSCSEPRPSVREAPAEIVCEIKQDYNGSPLGILNSMAVIDSSLFALSTEHQVYLYDMNGNPVSLIGMEGSSASEYMMPLIVRSDSESVYVWSAMTLKFVVYDKSGKYIRDCAYSSAVRDFLPFRDTIYIYTAGSASGHIIDIFDSVEGKVLKSIGEPTDAHKALLGWLSTAPICRRGEELFFLPQDRLSLMKYSGGNGNLVEVSSLDSDTFIVRGIASETDSRSQMNYRYSNPFTVSLLYGDSLFYILTSEGEYIRRENGTLSSDNRFCGIYGTNGGKWEKIATFPMDSFGYTNLVSSFGGNFYFVSSSTDGEEDMYTLNKLILKD